ncbi:MULTISPECIES: type II toxin-antitoxin system Phd/YefM family antitoxin [Eggerthellaceae]|mgnify:CR=1 FL=1|uniref:type II toxin-antitoxin system Phd/YefM family antitoxin n=1 Tax=Eggerthellaceae TaxID=1643826 RepID=UPI0001FD70B5|nr:MULTISPECIES: type II toxin-antitoxin system Phd/YefM family antitoxin [Eggerthellaceae]EGC88153.1 prevent-host-death family protein [Eggerthella sp. HGA1]MCB7087285.1 type II toxin-antitoxin system Phd/YefM family antitoxin [Gordonibacter urolithinfaciens]
MKNANTIGLSEAKAKLSSVAAQVSESGEPMNVYKNNRPYVSICPPIAFELDGEDMVFLVGAIERFVDEQYGIVQIETENLQRGEQTEYGDFLSKDEVSKAEGKIAIGERILESLDGVLGRSAIHVA